MHNASLVVAHPDPGLRTRIGDVFRSRDIQVYAVDDVAGIIAAARQSRPCTVVIHPAILINEPGDLRVQMRNAAGYHFPILVLTDGSPLSPGLRDALRRHGAHLAPGTDDNLVPIVSLITSVAQRLETADFFKKVVETPRKVPARAPRAGPKAVILVVDDELAIRQYITEALRDEGYEVHPAPGPEEALQILSQIEVDLVVSDVNMPGMDGFELKLQIDLWQRRPVPFIAITADASPENANNADAVGAVAFLSKPIRDMKTLFDSVSSALRAVVPGY